MKDLEATLNTNPSRELYLILAAENFATSNTIDLRAEFQLVYYAKFFSKIGTMGS